MSFTGRKQYEAEKQMKSYDIVKINKVLKRNLDKKRYEHTIAVSYIAAALAMRYQSDIKKARLAGLLHDCAKCISNEKQIELCQKYNIHINEAENKSPYLLHAKLGAFLTMHKYKIQDKDIISAILNHTTGKPNMSLLDKIIYVADYIEPGRDKAPDLDEIRILAFMDIDEALFKILSATLDYLQSFQGDIDPLTKKAYEYYKEELGK